MTTLVAWIFVGLLLGTGAGSIGPTGVWWQILRLIPAFFCLGIAILVALNGLKGGAWMSGGGFASADFALLTICVLIGYFLAILVTWLIRFLLPVKI